jgi:ribosomal subunit interface protein
MQSIQLTIRDIPSSFALKDHIRKKAEKLDHYYSRIQRCRIVVDVPQKHKHQGKLFRVRIDLLVPGKELVVNHKMDEDVYIAIRDAFNAVLRQLETYSSRRRGDIKVHDGINFGYVKRLYADEGYGFIQSGDGQEHYFSTTNVCYPSFPQLQIGDIVHFISVPANDGWQAHRITRNNHNHVVNES